MILLPYEEAIDLVKKSQKILLTMHERMDGDDGSATLALATYLESQGKKVTHFVEGETPKSLRFLPRAYKINHDLMDTDFDLLVISGCSTKDRIGNERVLALDIPVLNLDHHPDNTLYGTINLVDQQKSSVAEIVYDLFRVAEWNINAEIATCLLTGIFTDTGGFMHSNTNFSALAAASYLLQKGAQIDKIARNTFRSKAPQELQIWGKALENLHFDEQRKMIFTILSDKELEDKIPDVAAFDGLVEILNKSQEALFALFIRQEGGFIKGSLRSDPKKGVDVSVIARKFGGGGHRFASGFAIRGKITKNQEGKWEVTKESDGLGMPFSKMANEVAPAVN